MTESTTILIIDDSLFFLELIRSFFKRTGTKTLLATNAGEALDLLTRSKPDLILLDQYMPDMKGDELCRKIKENPISEKIPVIMVTSSNKKADMERCFSSGCDDYVTKPINREELLTKVNKYIEIITRAYERAPICVRMNYFYENGISEGQLNVISEGGAFIMGEEQLPVGSSIRLQFIIPGINKQLDVEGKVIWIFDVSEKFPQILSGLKGMGVQFTYVGDEDRKAIRDYVSLGNYLI